MKLNENGNIFCKNCKDFMKNIPNEYIDVIITSPPYNLNKSYENTLSLDKYIEKQSENIQDFFRILKPNGSIFWEVGNYVNEKEIVPLDILFYKEFIKYGFKLRNRIIWHFEHGLHAKTRFSGRYETILFFTKSDNYVFNLDEVRVPSKYPNKKYYKGPKKGQISSNPKGKNPGDIWNIILNDWEKEIWNIPNVKHNHPEKTIHPCSFPIELVERCILVASNEKDIIFDPFCGVGSSIIAAVKNKRYGIGCDINKEYCNVAKNRLKFLKEGALSFRPINRKIP